MRRRLPLPFAEPVLENENVQEKGESRKEKKKGKKKEASTTAFYSILVSPPVLGFPWVVSQTPPAMVLAMSRPTLSLTPRLRASLPGITEREKEQDLSSLNRSVL